MNRHSVPALLSCIAFAAVTAPSATAQKHPHFDDQGTLAWYTSMTEAKAAAAPTDKLIFLEYGRAA